MSCVGQTWPRTYAGVNEQRQGRTASLSDQSLFVYLDLHTVCIGPRLMISDVVHRLQLRLRGTPRKYVQLQLLRDRIMCLVACLDRS